MKFTKTVKRILVSVFSALFCVALGLFFSVGSVFTAKAAETVTTTKNMTCNGASIRLANDGQSGIRFHVRVKSNANRQAILDTTYSEKEFLELVSGILLIPSNKLPAGEELTLSTATDGYTIDGKKVKAANVTGEDCVWEHKQEGTTYYYEATAYIYNIPEKSYENNFTFRGYYTATNGTTYYTENTNNTRSVSHVALRAKIDDVETKEKSGETAGYQGTLLTQLNDFLPTKLVNTAKKFVNKDDYLYRVGNGNAVALSSLFDTSLVAGLSVTDFADSMASYLTWTEKTVTEKQNNLSCEISGTDAASATLQFSGTGVVELTISNPDVYTRGDNSASTTTMLFEVVNAKNATTATSATANNVVLLNDIGFSTISVGGGWTLYGNGFKMTSSSDLIYHSLDVGYVTMYGGTLENVQIVCPNPSYSVLYQANMGDSGNYFTRDAEGKLERAGNVRSAIMTDDKSTNFIINSYVSGGRTAIFAKEGILTVEKTTVDGGAVANIYVGSSSSLTLKDATLIQEPKQATVYDTSKTVMGMSVFAECSTTTFPTIRLEGTLVQYAWVNSDYKQYAPSGASSIVNTVLSQAAYKHNITYKDGVERESINLGIAFVNPEGTDSAPSPSIQDHRTDKTTVPYQFVTIQNLVKSSYVYSYANSNGTSDEFKKISDYKVAGQSQKAVLPTVSYNKSGSGIKNITEYTSGLGWNTTVELDLDTLGRNTDFSFAMITAKKNGQTLSYTVTDEDGFSVDTTKKFTFSETTTTNYVLTILDNQGYDAQGNQLPAVEYKYHFKLIITMSSILPPEKVAEPGGEALLVVKSKNSDWSCAIPALEGTQIKYYNKTQGDYVTLALSSLTPTSKGKQNGTNNYWEYSDPNKNYTLKVECSVIHEGKGVYGMPVVVDNNGYKMYFTISSTSGYVGTGTAARTPTITYTFTDANQQTITFTKAWNFQYANYKDGAQYKYSDFVSGKLNDLNSSSGDSDDSCVTADTLITLADGSQVRVDALTGNEQLLVWNMETGMLDSAPIMFNDSESATESEIIHLYFSDGTEVKVISEHGFWDYDLNRYVYLDNNAAAYIGHIFAKQDGDSLTKVQLVDVVLEYEVATAWSPVTVGHLCYFVNGMLSMPGGVGGLFNIFDVDAETMTYDYEAIARDIETYGLFTYEELNAIVELPESMFNEAGGAYLKISIAKGNMTMDELITMINRYKHFYE